ncbi:glycoside hydrolase family 3 protein [Sinanaerobacter sp. ZZT-01]|uniref:glycoside hydrolase family 3 protein n=1 Tax=Sinanaerobacter sp. ZZT-01 TaxID=3111540 RepID=UPI002D79EBFD|nr:glycoside hydrolase family 3 protein [Sinanaerobacter sp. ZZT-01]WRR93195.1 glycoside hydrolase family 3 protein [Sinanaerobacter sp. ZZT-01]
MDIKTKSLKNVINVLILIAIFTLASCSPAKGEDSDSANNIPDMHLNKTRCKAEKLLSSMTLEEKVGQLFMIRPDSLNPNLTAEQISDVSNYDVTELSSQMTESLQQYHAGGIVIFQKNILSPIQLTRFIDEMQGESKIPLFVGIDEEGGPVSRIANSKEFDVTTYESMAQIGAMEDSESAKNVGFTIGSYLKQYKFNLNFAPVADVNTNPKNIVIGNRSFGSDPILVAKMVSAEIEGFHKAGIMSCIKHFPGHGDTTGDTHKGFVSTEKTWEELKECELIPFMSASKDADMIMISHITAPNVTSDDLPSSLSNEMIEEKLRGEMNYNGVVITDSMAMGAITQEYTTNAAAVKAILGGADIILMPENFKEAYEGIYSAVKGGKISEKRIDKSVLRILSLKEKYDLLK